MLDNPFSEVKFPNIQSKPPLAQLEAISSCSITCYLGGDRPPPLYNLLSGVESKKVSPQLPFLQAKQPQFPQPLLIRLMLQTLPQLRCPSLDTLQHLNVSLVVGGPKLNTVCEGHDHFPSPAGHTIFDTSQDAIGFLGHLGTLLAHIQAAVNQHPQVLLCLAAFQPLFPKPVALHGVVATQVQDLALGLVEPQTIGPSPSIQPSLPTLKQINTPTQLGVVYKLTEGALDPFVQIIDKDIKQDWPQHRALGNTSCDWPPTGVNSIHRNSLGPAIQPVLYPAKSTPVQAMSSQFLQENAASFKYWKAAIRSPRSLLFSRLNNPNSLSLSSCRTLHLALLNLMRFTQAHFSSLSRSLWMVSHPSDVSTAPLSLMSSANLLRVHSIPLSMSLMKILNSTGPTIDHYPLDATIQPIPYPLNSPPIKSISLQFREKDVVGDHVKGFTEVQIDHIRHI
ncbi:LOW QUALITY PROTEIN: hypothetical protein QYF61_014189 [Mycteria americana]|uniref:Uncharacterized protein n=1 Tax=Mycteria americana TaxID=33587 RepID=A0AAN7S3I1_MYCAM|nr:LOW QUALITY PROTEIN: hypothetical protein QYF61_014189 [Mycteria americana]